jgi:hypothetical protein
MINVRILYTPNITPIAVADTPPNWRADKKSICDIPIVCDLFYIGGWTVTAHEIKQNGLAGSSGLAVAFG